MPALYRVHDWYWIVAGIDTQVYASARAAMIAATDENYATWLADGNVPRALRRWPN